jgi:hypothetical protein
MAKAMTAFPAHKNQIGLFLAAIAESKTERQLQRLELAGLARLTLTDVERLNCLALVNQRRVALEFPAVRNK